MTSARVPALMLASCASATILAAWACSCFAIVSGLSILTSTAPDATFCPRSTGISPTLPSTRAAMSDRLASTSPCTSRGSGRTRYQIERPATAAMTRATMMEGARAGRGRVSVAGFFAGSDSRCVAAPGVDSFISNPTALLDSAFARKSSNLRSGNLRSGNLRSGSSDRQSVTFHFSSWIFPWHRGVKMAIDQVRRSLYAGLHRTVFRFGLLIAAAWLFALFSYYLSMKKNADWFKRSGAVMGFRSAAVNSRVHHFYQRALPTALKEGLVSVQRGIELRLERPRPHVVLSYIAYLTC